MITASDLGVPRVFNAATHFVDRNVAAGRAAHVAIECGDEHVTCGDVLERVNRFGHALRERLNVRAEERVAMLPRPAGPVDRAQPRLQAPKGGEPAGVGGPASSQARRGSDAAVARTRAIPSQSASNC
jgi:hypothetical protein